MFKIIKVPLSYYTRMLVLGVVLVGLAYSGFFVGDTGMIWYSQRLGHVVEVGAQLPPNSTVR